TGGGVTADGDIGEPDRRFIEAEAAPVVGPVAFNGAPGHGQVRAGLQVEPGSFIRSDVSMDRAGVDDYHAGTTDAAAKTKGPVAAHGTEVDREYRGGDGSVDAAPVVTGAVSFHDAAVEAHAAIGVDTTAVYGGAVAVDGTVDQSRILAVDSAADVAGG